MSRKKTLIIEYDAEVYTAEQALQLSIEGFRRHARKCCHSLIGKTACGVEPSAAVEVSGNRVEIRKAITH